MEKLLGELVALRLMLAQVIAFVGAQQGDQAVFVADLRAAILRSLAASSANLGDEANRRVFAEAKILIETTLDSIGQVSE